MGQELVLIFFPMALAYALTTATKVKARLPNLTGVSTFDSLITELIDDVTDFIEKFCGRRFKKTTYTQEIYDGYSSSRGLKETLRLKNFPITTAVGVTSFQYQTGTSTWADFQSTDYIVDYDAGILQMLNGKFPEGFRNIRVTYEAGYTIDFTTEANHTLPRDIENLATKLVIREFKRREHIGKSSETIGSDTVQWLNVFDHDIALTLAKYQKLEMQ